MITITAANLKAFHGDAAIKKKYVARVIAHQKADHLVRGLGWENEDGKIKGCAVGCTLENYDHSQYPVELGIPEWLARVEDTLFEGMSEKKSHTWPEIFLKSVNIGADLEQAKAPFMIKILERNLVSLDACVFDRAKNPAVVKAVEGSRAVVKEMIRLWQEDPSGDKSSARSAARSAWSAAESAESAARSARSAARSAAWSAESAAESAESARSAARSAWSAAESAESAAWSAARSAAWPAARSAAWPAAAARSETYDYFADELIKILKGIK